MLGKTAMALGAFVGIALFTPEPWENRVRHAVASPGLYRSRIGRRYPEFTAVAGSAVTLGRGPVGVVVWPLPP